MMDSAQQVSGGAPGKIGLVAVHSAVMLTSPPPWLVPLYSLSLTLWVISVWLGVCPVPSCPMTTSGTTPSSIAPSWPDHAFAASVIDCSGTRNQNEITALLKPGPPARLM